MHTYTAHVPVEGTDTVHEYYFLFNSDMSGEVTISEPAYQDTLSSDNECKIPGEALLDFLSYVAGSAFQSWAEDLDLKAFLEKYR